MATVYVSKSGAAGRSGERSDPLVSLAAAITSLNSSGSGPHELIIMDDGVYSEANLGNSPVLARDDITIMAETGSSGLPVVSPSIRGSGSAAAAQNFAIYCDNNWLIKGITFRDFVIAANNGVIKPRSLSADEGGIKVELCTFHNITGSCIYLDVGSDGTDPGIHTIDGNTFYNINTGGSGSAGSIIQLTNTKDLKMKVVNNVFYDWQPRGTADNIIHIGNASNTQRPLCVISHNTFGTSSAETGAGSVVIPTYAVEANLAKFEYNIIKDQTTVTSFADIASGEANYNIYHNVTSTSPGTNAPFGDSTAPTGALNNRNIDPLLTGPFVDSTANYRLSGVASPAFDATFGSSDATKDRTGGTRITLDLTALATGILNIGAFEATGLFSSEQPDSSPQVSGDFTINRIPNADNQNKRSLQSGNSSILGHDVDQVPLTTAINGAIPSFIRKRPTANTQETGKKG